MNADRNFATRFLRLPFAIKVPLIVAMLMLLVSTVATFQVFARLVETQERTLTDLTEAYLDGLSSSLLPHVQRDDNWEVFDSLERSRALYRGLKVTTALITRPDRSILASTDPARFATESLAPDLAMLATRAETVSALKLDIASRTWLTRDLVFQGRRIGTIHAEVDLTHLRAERREVLSVLIATNLGLTLTFVALGWWLVRRMLAPLRVLTRHMESGIDGPLLPIPAEDIGRTRSEFGRLFRRYNAMAQALVEREALKARLAEEERLASLGRLSSIIAHEINNPLGGLLNAVDTIKHHGTARSVREGAIGLIERGLNNIRDVVGMTLAIYRPDRNPRPLRRKDVDDLRLLVDSAALRREIRLVWRNRLDDESRISSGPLRQILLNLAINAIQAAPIGGTVLVEMRRDQDTLHMTVEDNGPGLPEAIRETLESASPAPAPRPGSGIGVWMVTRLVADLGGRITIAKNDGLGTRIEITLPEPEKEKIRNVA